MAEKRYELTDQERKNYDKMLEIDDLTDRILSVVDRYNNPTKGLVRALVLSAIRDKYPRKTSESIKIIKEVKRILKNKKAASPGTGKQIDMIIDVLDKYTGEQEIDSIEER